MYKDIIASSPAVLEAAIVAVADHLRIPDADNAVTQAFRSQYEGRKVTTFVLLEDEQDDRTLITHIKVKVSNPGGVGGTFREFSAVVTSSAPDHRGDRKVTAAEVEVAHHFAPAAAW